jgi:hypothetical protein
MFQFGQIPTGMHFDLQNLKSINCLYWPTRSELIKSYCQAIETLQTSTSSSVFVPIAAAIIAHSFPVVPSPYFSKAFMNSACSCLVQRDTVDVAFELLD